MFGIALDHKRIPLPRASRRQDERGNEFDSNFNLCITVLLKKVSGLQWPPISTVYSEKEKKYMRIGLCYEYAVFNFFMIVLKFTFRKKLNNCNG
jgi:hypothetical protein